MREVVFTKDAPQAIGPYSQAIKANGFVFTSGQIAINPATQQVVTGDVAAQTDRVLRNVSEILEAAGSGLGKVVRSTVFLKNMNLRLRLAPPWKWRACRKMCWWKLT
jgi:2-iminobutanoate/2-iminopropanoate deaminase